MAAGPDLPLDLTRLRAAYAAGTRSIRSVSSRRSCPRLPQAMATRSGSAASTEAGLRARPLELGRRRRPSAARSTASRSRSRTTSTSPGCPRPPAAPFGYLPGASAGGRAAAGRRRDPAWARPTSISSRPGWSASARPTASPATRSTDSSPGAPARARRWPSPRGWSASTGHGHRRLGPRTRRLQQHRRPQADPGPPQHRGVVPACRSLDCVSVFALTGADAVAVPDVAGGFDPGDPFRAGRSPAARPRRTSSGWACRRRSPARLPSATRGGGGVRRARWQAAAGDRRRRGS